MLNFCLQPQAKFIHFQHADLAWKERANNNRRIYDTMYDIYIYVHSFCCAWYHLPVKVEDIDSYRVVLIFKDPAEALVSRYFYNHCKNLRGAECGATQQDFPSLER